MCYNPLSWYTTELTLQNIFYPSRIMTAGEMQEMIRSCGLCIFVAVMVGSRWLSFKSKKQREVVFVSEVKERSKTLELSM